jgi:hypothetical protein
MSEREQREMARLRKELRDRLMNERTDGVADVLACLRRFADRQDDGVSDLRREYDRWRLRFELIARAERA